MNPASNIKHGGIGCCKMCKQPVSKFAKSHIIPRGFFSGLPDKCKIESVFAEGYRRSLPDAIWDAEILCPACERRLGRYDECACQVFVQKREAQRIRLSGLHGLFSFRRVNRTLLRGFLATLLWRMSVSKQREFAGVSIGETYEEKISSDVLRGGAFNYVDALAWHWAASEFDGYFGLPVRKRVSGVNGYSVQLPFLNFHVSLDQRPNPYFKQINNNGEKTGSPFSLSSSSEGLPYGFLDTPFGTTDVRSLNRVLGLYRNNRSQFLEQMKISRKRKQGTHSSGQTIQENRSDQ